MSLFNEIKVDAANLEDRNIIGRLSDFRETHIAQNQTVWNDAHRDYLFEAGDPSVYLDYHGSPYPLNSQPLVINKIRNGINSVSGYQRRTRNSLNVVPVENADQDTADQLTKVLMWAIQKDKVQETFSDGFNDAMITGLSFLEMWVDYRDDPLSGNIKLSNCPVTSIMIDTFFRKKDLSDCNGIWKRSYLSLQQVKSLLDGRVDYDVEKLDTVENPDYQFTYMPESMYSKNGKFYTYDEFYYADARKQKIMVDSETGAVVEIYHDDEQHIKEVMSEFPNAQIKERYIPTIKVAIIVNNRVIYDGLNPTGLDCYPFVPIFAYFRPELTTYSGRIQGLVRSMRDPSYFYNIRKKLELEGLTKQINTGLLYKPDALVDINDVNKTGEGKNVAIKSEFAMQDAVTQLQPIPLAPTTLEVSNILERLVASTVGLNEELLGSAIDDKAAILSMFRQRAGLTSLQSVFDNLDYAMKLCGDNYIKLTQLNFMPAKIKRIINEEPSEQFYNRNFGIYDCVIEEGFDTSTQRQLNFSQLMQLKQEAGIEVPQEFIINAATIQNKKELVEALNKQQEAVSQQAQQAQELEQQEAKARIDMFEAKAQYDNSGSSERQSKVVDNLESSNERKAKAMLEIEEAKLNIAKTLEELKNIPWEEIRKLAELSKVLKQDEEVINAKKDI